MSIVDALIKFVSVPNFFFSSSPHPDWIWGPHSFLCNGYRWIFPRCKAAGAWSWPYTSVQCRG